MKFMNRRKRMLNGLGEDLREYLEIETQDNLDRGMTPAEARYAALRKFGNTALVQEDVREVWSWTWLDRFVQDVRFGFRSLRRAKWISLAAVATLALGIGANTALFSVVYTVLLRSLPFPDSDRLVMLAQRDPHTGASMDYFAPTTFFDWCRQNHSFESMGAIDQFPEVQMALAGRGEPVPVTGQGVSSNFLEVLGVRPALGRTFRPDEDFPNRNLVALVSYALWQSRFGASAAVIGEQIKIDGFPVKVIGVLPPDFEFLGRPDFLMPLARDPNARWREGRELQIVARLRPGASVAQAEANLTALTRQIEHDGPPILTGASSEARLTPLIESYVGEVRPALLVLLGAVVCVLLIACSNVANLLLARATTRRREMAVRASLGASRGRLIRQLLTESLVLTVVGALLGVLVAWWGARFLAGLVPAGMPIPRLDRLRPNAAILAFTLGVTLVTAFVVGIVPALQASRKHLGLAIRHGGRALGGGRLLRESLVAVEIGLAAVLLIPAGLLLRTFAYLRRIDPGFSDRNVLACRLKLPDAQYRTGQQQAEYFAQVIDRVRGLPGVRSAAAIDGLPVSGAGGGTWVHVEGKPEPPPGQQVNVMVRTITPGYFSTIGVPLYAGRDFTEADRGILDLSRRQDPAQPLKLIVNQALVDRFLPGENPLGRRLAIFWGQTLVGEIVGVVGNVRYRNLAEEEDPTFYWPEAQRPKGDMHVVIRTAGQPAGWVGAVRAAVRSVDPDVPVAEAETLTEVVALASSRTRFSLVLLGAFAVIALVLAAVGLFGVMGYAMAQRTQEIGVRIALGARQASILGMALRGGVRLAIIGLTAGTAAAVALTRFIATQLHGVKPLDPWSFALAIGLLLAVATLSAYLPARRASRVDPMTALRCE
jgi:putative ABC transport system permease protein